MAQRIGFEGNIGAGKTSLIRLVTAREPRRFRFLSRTSGRVGGFGKRFGRVLCWRAWFGVPRSNSDQSNFTASRYSENTVSARDRLVRTQSDERASMFHSCDAGPISTSTCGSRHFGGYGGSGKWV